MTTEISEEEIKTEVERIASALGKEPPDEIEVEYPFITKSARFEKNGKKLILQGGWGLKDIQDQIVWSYLNRDRKQHPNPLVRNPHRYDMILTVLLSIGFLILVISFPMIHFFLRILSIVGLISSHLIISYVLGEKKQAYALFIAEYMRKTNHWSKEYIEEFLDGANLMGFGISLLLAIILFVFGIAFSFVF